MLFRNTTTLESAQMHALLLRHTWPYRHDKLDVRVRWSRGGDYSGSCYYATSRLHINLGRANRYPYALGTHVARAENHGNYWQREIHRLIVADAYQLALFIYLHELYHFLVKAAGRNTRRKESYCDRFATRVLVDQHGCPLLDGTGCPVPRRAWDFKDVEAFVAAAPRESAGLPAPPTPPPPAGAAPIPVFLRGLPTAAR